MEHCQATRADGRPCTARPLPGQPYCFAHAPSLADRRKQANAAGGKHKATAKRLDRLTPATLRPLLEKFISAVDAVETGALEPRQAAAMAALGTTILKFYELGQMEVALQETQAQLDALRRGQTG